MLLCLALVVAGWRVAPVSDASPEIMVPLIFEAAAKNPETTAPEPEPAAAEAEQPQPPSPEPPQAQPEPPQPDTVSTLEPPPPPPEPPPESPSPSPPVEATQPPSPPPPRSPPPRATAHISKPRPGPAAAKPAETTMSGPPASTAPQSTQPTTEAAPAWNTLLSAWLAAHKTYPEIARQRGEHGTVTLRLKVGADGTILDVTLVSGSGSTVLDHAAEALLRGARLPPPDTDLTRTVRLRYQLED